MVEASITGKPQLNRRVNRTLILNRIRERGEVSRADLAKITRIKPPTVSAVVRDLLDDGLLIETGIGETNGGRAPRMVALSCQTPQAMGFEITETAILGGLYDLLGDAHVRERVEFGRMGPEAAVERLASAGERLMAAHAKEHGSELTWSGFKGIGVAVPGVVDSARRIVHFSHPLGWEGVSLGQLCEERWGVRTDVINDSAAGAMAAHFFADHPVENLAYLVLRFADWSNGVVGLGTGLIVQGEPYHGEFGAAGEITTPVRHPIVVAREDHGVDFVDLSALTTALAAGDPVATAVIERVAGELVQLVTYMLNFFEPGQLVIECDCPTLGQLMLERIRGIIAEHAVLPKHSRTEAILATLDEGSGVRGAVVPALRRFFRLPRWK